MDDADDDYDVGLDDHHDADDNHDADDDDDVDDDDDDDDDHHHDGHHRDHEHRDHEHRDHEQHELYRRDLHPDDVPPADRRANRHDGRSGAGRSGPGARRRGRILVPILVALAAIVAVGFFVFEPHKLVLDQQVDESLPVAAGPTTAPAPSTVAGAAGPPTSTGGAPPSATTSEPRTLRTGGFVSLEHDTKGQAMVIELTDASRYVRLEDFDTSNGPDLYLYLTAAPSNAAWSAFDDDFVSLGRLKGNIGNQNYQIPPNTDLSRYPTVVIWCDRFDAAFGAAPLA